MPASQPRQPSLDQLGPELEAALASPGDPLMAPLRVIWRGPMRDGQRTVSALSLLTMGDPRDPNWLRQAWVLQRDPAALHELLVVVVEANANQC